MANEDSKISAEPAQKIPADPAPKEPAPTVAADAFGQYKARLAMRAEPAPSFSMPHPGMPGLGSGAGAAGFEMLARSVVPTLRLGVNLLNAALWSGANALTAIGRWEGEMGEHHGRWDCDDGCGPDCCEQFGCGCCRPQVRGC